MQEFFLRALCQLRLLEPFVPRSLKGINSVNCHTTQRLGPSQLLKQKLALGSRKSVAKKVQFFLYFEVISRFSVLESTLNVEA